MYSRVVSCVDIPGTSDSYIVDSAMMSEPNALALPLQIIIREANTPKVDLIKISAAADTAPKA
jgi:hypothetical protein